MTLYAFVTSANAYKSEKWRKKLLLYCINQMIIFIPIILKEEQITPMKLANIGLTCPDNNKDVEREFNKQNIVKILLKSNLKMKSQLCKV